METTRERGHGALITGASRGIGRATALRLARDGFNIAVNYLRSAGEAAEVARQVEAAGCRAIPLAADMADEEAATRLFDEAEERIGPIEVLVSNAGITRDRLLIQMSEDDWDAIWQTDLAGPRALCQAAISVMSGRQGGRIVTVGSVVGSLGNAGQANYASAKAAVEGMTRELAVKAAPHGITVNCVVPGYITTDAVAHLTEAQVAAWYERIPMRRNGTVEDIAELIAFFAGSQSGYITGQCVAVDGGLLARAGAGLHS
jgi:3-oxoacyl-[acyl-carrier protein] reductase